MYSDMSKRTSSTPSVQRELTRDLGLADARSGPANRKEPTGLLWSPSPERDILIAGRERLDRAVLAVDHELEVALEVAQHVAIAARDRLGRDARDARDDVLDVRDRNGLLALGHGLEPQTRARLVDHVDGLVRQVAVVDVARGQLGRRDQRLVLVAHAVVLLERRLSPRRISMVSPTLGSTMSIFWKRRVSAWSFSKMPRYSW